MPGLVEALGPDDLAVAVALNNLAAIVQGRGDLEAAESLYRRVLAIKERALGGDSAELAVSLNNLGTVLRARGRTGDAIRSTNARSSCSSTRSPMTTRMSR